MSSYVGVEPRSNNGLRDYFAGNGVLTSFTLSSVPGGANGIIVAISGVIQKPGVSYFVSGKTLTFSEAPPLPPYGEVNNIEVIYLQRLGTTPAVNWKMSPVAANTGTVDALVATYSPVNTALTDNLMLYVVVSGPNATTTPTFSPDGLPAKVIVNGDGGVLPINRLRGTVLLKYSTSTSKWTLVSTSKDEVVSLTSSLAGTSGSLQLNGSDVLTIDSAGKLSSVNTPATGLRSTALATMQKFADEFKCDLSAGGWQKLSSGLIIQWGTAANNVSADAWTAFPITFPNICCSIVLTGNGGSGSGPLFGTVGYVTQYGVSTGVWGAGGSRIAYTLMFIAIGY